MAVETIFQQGAVPLNRPLRVADVDVWSAEPVLAVEPHLVYSAAAENCLAGFTVVDSRLEFPDQPAMRRHFVQRQQPGMVDGTGGFDELLGPANRLVLAAQIAKARRVNRDGGGFGEMVVVGGPPERGAQVRKL